MTEPIDDTLDTLMKAIGVMGALKLVHQDDDVLRDRCDFVLGVLKAVYGWRKNGDVRTN